MDEMDLERRFGVESFTIDGGAGILLRQLSSIAWVYIELYYCIIIMPGMYVKCTCSYVCTVSNIDFICSIPTSIDV